MYDKSSLLFEDDIDDYMKETTINPEDLFKGIVHYATTNLGIEKLAE